MAAYLSLDQLKLVKLSDAAPGQFLRPADPNMSSVIALRAAEAPQDVAAIHLLVLRKEGESLIVASTHERMGASYFFHPGARIAVDPSSLLTGYSHRAGPGTLMLTVSGTGILYDGQIGDTVFGLDGTIKEPSWATDIGYSRWRLELQLGESPTVLFEVDASVAR